MTVHVRREASRRQILSYPPSGMRTVGSCIWCRYNLEAATMVASRSTRTIPLAAESTAIGVDRDVKKQISFQGEAMAPGPLSGWLVRDAPPWSLTLVSMRARVEEIVLQARWAHVTLQVVDGAGNAAGRAKCSTTDKLQVFTVQRLQGEEQRRTKAFQYRRQKKTGTNVHSYEPMCGDD